MRSGIKFLQSMVRCSLLERGAGKPFYPGYKRFWTPEWDRDKCIRCGLCYLYCPDGAVYRNGEGFFEVDKDRCKGCGVCHRECWFGAISLVKEE